MIKKMKFVKYFARNPTARAMSAYRAGHPGTAAWREILWYTLRTRAIWKPGPPSWFLTARLTLSVVMKERSQVSPLNIFIHKYDREKILELGKR